jgi:hypothetical protein
MFLGSKVPPVRKADKVFNARQVSATFRGERTGSIHLLFDPKHVRTTIGLANVPEACILQSPL